MSGETDEYVRDSFETAASGLYPGALVDWGEIVGGDEVVSAGDYGCVESVEIRDDWTDGALIRFENKPPILVHRAALVRVFKP